MKKIILIISLFILVFAKIDISAQYWKKINSIPSPYSNNYWLDVFFHPSNPNYGWICGFNGMVIYTSDGGTTWQGSSVPNAYHLESIHFPTLSTGYTSGVDGIFKSTDGGNSWFDITPSGSRDSTTFWGCFFLNENYGILLGDGCGTGRRQHFWLTTDGGNTWSVFLGAEDNSGLTDAILFPNGSGYASSSGKIWITSDSGRTWNVLSNIGSNLWQEEITNYDNSFLVPYSGFSCTGGGNNGGMCFSTDYGFTWNRTQTGVPMFGTFLLNNFKGWACGYSRAVYYTSNGGVNWVQHNCGIANGNLDDLWFISENNGWVVGEGVYKLSNPIGTVNSNFIDFGNVCIGQKQIDTIWFVNYNFNDANVQFSISPQNSNFYIENPGNSALVQSCDSIMVIISFMPTKNGISSANLIISPPYQGDIIIPLIGTGVETTARLQDTLIIIPSVICGQQLQTNTIIHSDNSDEKVSSLQKLSGDDGISIITSLPLQIFKDRINYLTINVLLQDTGWATTQFRVRFSPCEKDQVLTIRAYGKSPIIFSDSAVTNTFFCRTAPIYLRVQNDGNDTLRIFNLKITPNTNLLTIDSWKSGRSMAKSQLAPKESDSLILILDPNFEGELDAKLIISNNDLTTTRGVKNNLIIPIKIYVYSSKLSTSDLIIDFGKVCIGDTITKSLWIYNDGNLDENIYSIQKKLKDLSITSNKIFPYSIQSKDSSKFFIKLCPTRLGSFLDTIKFISQNCPDTLLVLCKGQGILHQIDYSPNQIIASQPKSSTKSYLVKIWSVIPDSLNISQIHFIYDSSSILFTLQSFSTTFSQLDTGSIVFSIKGNIPGRISAVLVITIDGVCIQQVEIPINVLIFDKNLVIEPNSFDFGITLCEPEDSLFQIRISNRGAETDTIITVYILQNHSQFQFKTSPPQPLIIPPNSSEILELIYKPTFFGFDTATVVFYFSDTSRNFKVPVYAFYGKSLIQSSPASINLGIFEYCLPHFDTSFSISNAGNISDTLEVFKGFTNSCFTTNSSLIVLAQDSTSEVKLSFVPSIDILGEISDTLIFQSKICKEKIPFSVTASIFKPQFEISPDYVELGELWIGDTLSFELVYKNNSNFLLEFIFKGLQNYSPNFLNNFPFEKILSGYSYAKVSFTIVANKSGDFFDTLIFEVKSECIYKQTIIIHYYIPDENYKLKLKIGKYVFAPGKSEVIEIKNEIPNPKLRLDTLLFKIVYDRYLFEISECYTSWSSTKIQTTSNFGESQLIISEESLREFLSKSNTIFCYGNTYYSTPDTTTLLFDGIKYFPSKSINIDLENGFLQISPICKPVGSLRLSIFSTFEVQNHYLTDNQIILEILATDNTSVSFVFFDFLGKKVYSTTKLLNQGYNKVNLVFDDELSHGIYTLRVYDTITSYNIIIPFF